jgi:hypothetical protein
MGGKLKGVRSKLSKVKKAWGKKRNREKKNLRGKKSGGDEFERRRDKAQGGKLKCLKHKGATRKKKKETLTTDFERSG